MNHILPRRPLAVSLFLAGAAFSSAAQPDRPWYVNLQGGSAFGQGTFRSITEHQIHWGYQAGLSAGYRFSRFLSLEAGGQYVAPIALVPVPAATGYSLGYSSLQVPQDGVKKIIVEIDGYEYEFASANDIPLTGGKYTTLTTAPKLAATTLAKLCCYCMFMDCTSLTTIPDNMLPATTLQSECYAWMFKGCSKLTTVPNTMLPATTLAANCYTQMFQECTSLTTAPNLPAEELVYRCYSQMFLNCSSLTATPTLSFTTVAEGCCSDMFYGCTKLSTVPVLASTKMEKRCYGAMFARCTSLTTIPTGMLPATNLANSCYYGMFSGCTSLYSVPSGLLPATNLEKDCYHSMFEGCTSLTTGLILPAEELVYGCYREMFASCSNLSSVICLANPSTISVGDKPIKDWLKLVAETGTFYAKYSWSGYEDYIPSGWTVEDYNP